MVGRRISQLINLGKKKGYLTYDEINRFLPEEISKPEDLDAVVEQLDQEKIRILETKETGDESGIKRSSKEETDGIGRKIPLFLRCLMSWAKRFFKELFSYDSMPKWFKSLPDHLKPFPEKVERLESLRKTLNMSDQLFIMGIANSRWAVIKAQEAMLEIFRRELPDRPEKELWRRVIFSRFEIKLKSPASWDLSTEELLKEMESMDQIMTNIHSWEDTLEFILQMDKDAFSFDPSGIQDEINKILSE